MGLALIIIGLLLLVGSIGYFVFKDRIFIKSKKTKMGKKRFKTFLFTAIAGAVGSLITNIGLAVQFKWAEKTSYTTGVFEGKAISFPLQMTAMVIGVVLLTLAIFTLVFTFRLRYYKPNIDPELRKLASKVMFISIPVLVVSFLIWSCGIGSYLVYPIWSGFGIDDSGFHFTATSSGMIWEAKDGYALTADYMNGGFKIAFYALFILLGFGICYWISDHKLYQLYGKHGTLDVTGILAFFSGIIGARIWYVVGNYQREFAGHLFPDAFQIWNGGLTILGGALFGFICGFIMVRLTHKEFDMRKVIDIIVPTILLAQAVGRMGNFTNIEVYGREVSINGTIWQFLPNWLLQQMNYTGTGASLGAGIVNVPLCFVEASINVIGYFVIRFAIGKGLKKFIVDGDLCGCYFAWYGIVRFILEPLRNTNYNMGMDNSWSICNSLAYIFVGAAIMILCHVKDLSAKDNAKKIILPITGGVSLLALIFPILKSITVSKSVGDTVWFNGFDIMFNKGGTVALVAYIAVAVSGIIYLATAFLKESKTQQYMVYAAVLLSFVGFIMFMLSSKGLSFTIDTSGEELTYNASYGFVLVGLVALCAGASGFGYAWAKLPKKEKPVVEEVATEDADV